VELEVVRQRVIEMAADICGRDASEITAESRLIGDDAILDSRSLVELLLTLEEFAEDELGVTFDWSGDSAMSQRRSMFRSIGTLSEHIAGLKADA
jgi:acyl carrier protein